jgi:putative SOS response-associated peptidase YedK
MCYDIKASIEAQLKRARRHGDPEAIREIKDKLVPLTDLPLFHTTGFRHPKLLVYTDRSPLLPEVAIWGLIPHWVKDGAQRQRYWNNTLNARGETIFEKPAFRDAARDHRCIIAVDGFYEHHHYKENTYPFFIYRKDGEPMSLAGIWNEWADPETGEVLLSFSIVTTRGNTTLGRIHNNPKLEGPRMPVILPEDLENDWLAPVNDALDINALETLIQPFPDEMLGSHTTGRLRGREYRGNVPGIDKEIIYPELSIAD